MVKADAVFKGAGVRGIGFIGAVCFFEEMGYQWEKLAGTSAGAIIAALLAVGYKGSELKDIMTGLNYRGFLDKTVTQSVPLLGKPLGLVKDKSMYNGDALEEWLQKLFQKKGKTKFKDVSVNGVSTLKIIASDITRKEMIIIPDHIGRYGVEPMEFDISRAVRMSASIPFYFKPVRMECKTGVSYIVDGGLLSNFPVWIFDVKGIPRWPTIGFKIKDSKPSNTAQGKKDLFSYAFDIVNTILDRDEEAFLMDKDNVRTVTIPSLGIQTTDFNITRNNSSKIFQSGYESAMKFLERWNFRDYVQRYRVKKY